MVADPILRPRFPEHTTLRRECQAARQDVALTDESVNLPCLSAEPPDLPIDSGLAGPGMLADTIAR